MDPMGKWAIWSLAFVLSVQIPAQEIKSYDKAAEREKFHSKLVRGTPAAEVQASFRKRLNMESDSVFGNILWRNVGPEVQSGRVMMICSPESNPKQIFVAFATGGLYRSDDEGQTWESLWDNQPSFGIGDIYVSKDGKTIYLGTGEANNQRTSYAGTGMYKSVDGGKTWKSIGLPESHHISRITVDPKNEKVLWVGVMGHLYSQNSERGIYKSTDGGESWNHVLKRDEFTGGNEVAIHPKNGNVAIASLYQRDRRAWNFLEAGPGSGSFRTEDGGKTWKPIGTLPSGEKCGRTGFAWSPSDANIVYAFIENAGKNEDWLLDDERVASGRLTPRRFYQLTEETFLEVEKEPLETFWKANAPADYKLDDVQAAIKAKKTTMKEVRAKLESKNPNIFEFGANADELYKSIDGGKTFKLVQKFGSVGGYYWNRVFVNPKDANDVWVTALQTLRSRDGGKTWKDGANWDVHVDYHAIHWTPSGIYVGNDGGVYLSRNDGKSWTHLNNLSVGQTTTVAVDSETPYNIYTGLQDNGTMKGPSTYRPGSSDLNLWKAIGGGDGSAIAVDPRDELGLVYIASQFGAHSAIEQKTGKRYSARPRPPKGETQRANWISPIIISSHHNDIVYVGFNRLYRSFNRGKSYQPISPDLTRNRPNGDVPHSTIKDVSESPLRFGLIYCGADDGRITVTQDGGFTWTDIPTPEPEKWVSRVVASKYDEATVYVAQNGYREDDINAYLWKSTDFGKTWKSIAKGLPSEAINVIREDPKNKDILYVGTDLGVFVTFDGGTTWETLHGGLGKLPVHDMVIQERENDLVIATHAKGNFILDLDPVVNVKKEWRDRDLTILEAKNMTRSRTWGYENREQWQSEGPTSPTFKFQFFAKSAGTTTIELIDDKGSVVKSLKLDALKGYNFGSIDLLVKPESKTVLVPSPLKSGQDATKDPFEANRPKFLEKGSYKLVISQGNKKVEQEWKLE